MAKQADIGALVKKLGNTNPEIAAQAAMELTERLESGEVTAVELLPVQDEVLQAYRARRDALLPKQQAGPGIGWMWDEDYVPLRYEAEILLDLLGYMPAAAVKELLREAVHFQDPLLKFWAIMSLFRQEEPVDPVEIRKVADSPVTRNKLFFLLDDLDKLELLPPEATTQQALAESDMVEWLAFPTELACQPDDMELVTTIARDFGEPYGIGDYFVFRFRTHPPHWAADQGWMLGVSGPFLRKEQPTPESYGHTFSPLQPESEMTPEELVDEVQELFGHISEMEDEE